MKIILASASPRRARILSDAGIPFEIVAVEIDESRHPGEVVEALTCRLAESKARAALRTLSPSAEPAVIVGADTVVELDGAVFGKPGTPAAAREMLQRLSGKTHRVITGIAAILVPDGTVMRIEAVITSVQFTSLTSQEIECYAASSEPLDKAGAYAVQGFGGRFVEKIEGCYFNVVGLPLARVYRFLKELGWTPYSTH